MTETQVLNAPETGAPHAAEELLPLVYAELRRLAARKLAQEYPGQTLQATALVHESYLRLVGGPGPEGPLRDQPQWEGRGHFFAAAAEARRRILVERARHEGTLKCGKSARRVDIDGCQAAFDDRSQELLALDEALDELQRHHSQAAELVKLRYFGGLSHQEAAQSLRIGRRAADRLWALARAWLYQRIGEE